MLLRIYSQRIVIAGTILIWTIKFLLRPFVHVDEPLRFILGIAPNFIGSFLIPFAAYWLYTHPLFFNGMLLRFNFFSNTRIVCFFGFSLAVVNEYLQLIPVFGRTFDYYDILFSGVALFLSYYAFSAVQRNVLAQEL